MTKVVFAILAVALALGSCGGPFGASVPEELLGTWVYDYGPGTRYFTFTSGELITGETSDYAGVDTYEVSEEIVDVLLEEQMLVSYDGADNRHFVWHIDGNVMYCDWEWNVDPAHTGEWWAGGDQYIKQ